VHPLNSYQGLPNDDLGAAKQQRIPMERLELHPDLPSWPTTVFPIDQGVDNNPVVPNPVTGDDDLGGVVKPTIISAPTDVGGINKPQQTPVKHDSDDSDEDSVDSLVDGILNPNSSDEESLSDEDDSVRPVGTPATESTSLNGTNKPQGMFSRLFSGCFSVAKSIFCWPFRCFFWCCGYDSAASEKKSN
jgi:hypothetical protein